MYVRTTKTPIFLHRDAQFANIKILDKVVTNVNVCNNYSSRYKIKFKRLFFSRVWIWQEKYSYPGIKKELCTTRDPILNAESSKASSYFAFPFFFFPFDLRMKIKPQSCGKSWKEKRKSFSRRFQIITVSKLLLKLFCNLQIPPPQWMAGYNRSP